jgi:flagellar basal-body rod protein FlgG
MSDAYINVYTALETRMRMVDITTNNLANANTIGYKRDFGSVLEAERGLGIESEPDLSPGAMTTTGNPLDAAIDGQGFFVIQAPDGVRYTRTGSFSLNADGELVTKDGMPVLSSSGSPISVGEGVVAIQDGGAVTVDGSEVATLKIVTVDDPRNLEKVGGHRFRWNGPASGLTDADEPRVKGGVLERSNVNAVDEMVHLMAAYREFEAAQRTLRTFGEMNAKLIQEMGRIS